jgi:hypothetical protein
MNWPPLYPLFLSLFACSGSDPFLVGPHANKIFVVLGIIILFLLSSALGLGLWAHLLTVLSLVLSSTVIMGGSLLAEPLYFFLSCFGLYALWRSMDNQHPASRAWPIIWGVLCCGAALSRYLGMSLWISGLGLLAVVQIRKEYFRQRAFIPFFSSTLILPPLFIAIWLLRNRLVSDGLGYFNLLSRLGFPDFPYFRFLILWPGYQFLWPNFHPRWFANYSFLLLAALLAVIIFYNLRRWYSALSHPKRLLFLYIGGYLFLYLVMSFANRSMMYPEDLQRFFQPVYPVFLLWILMLIPAQKLQSRIGKPVFISLFLLCMIINLNKSIRYVPNELATGYNGYRVTGQEVCLPEGTVLGAGKPLLVYYLFRYPVVTLSGPEIRKLDLKKIHYPNVGAWIIDDPARLETLKQ